MENFYWTIFITAILFITKSEGLPASKLQKLLVVSLDAFRYDYFDRKVTPYLEELKTRGIYADYMINAFTTKTFPNHHTIATGLYVDKHGVVDSEYYDPKSGKKIKYSAELYHYNNSILPIWILNEKAGGGRRSGTEMWPGSEFEYDGRKPTFSKSWKMGASLKGRIDEIISWFNHSKTPINFAMLYIEEPDYHGHNIGINNDRFNKVLKKIDDTTRYLYKQLKENGLGDVNVIHVSDHGMSPVTLNRIVDLNKYVNQSDYIAAGYAPVMNIYPIAGKERWVYTQFQKAAREIQGFDVYLKRDIPQRYHYSDNPRIGPILVVNKVGYSFQTLYDDFPWIEQEFNVTIGKNSEFGLHGYDNMAPDMHPIFFGVGPAFLPRCKIPPFNNIDLVPLFCDILGIPQPSVDGTLNVFKQCLRKYYDLS